MRFNLNLGYDISRTEGKTYAQLGSFTSMSNAAEDYLNDYTNYNANTLLEFYGNYNKEINKNRIDVMAGYSWQHNYVKYNQTKYFNSNRDEVYQVSPKDAKEYYLISCFGRVNYSYDSRYLFTASWRDDASSRFSKKNRWGLFPSVAAAWNIAQESFLLDSKAISSLKLRFCWGKTGEQYIGMDRCYAYMAKYT